MSCLPWTLLSRNSACFVCVCVCVLPEGKLMINSTENSSILPKLNIKRVVPPRFIPLDVFFFSGKVGGASTSGQLRVSHFLTWSWYPERLSPLFPLQVLMGVSFLCWTRTVFQTAQARSSVSAPPTLPLILGRGDRSLACSCPQTLGLTTRPWGFLGGARFRK